VVASVRGHALASGCGLVALSDMAIAAENTTFGTPEINIGLFPLFIFPALIRTIGQRHALDLCLTGRSIDAAEALAMGLVNRVVHAAELMGSAKEMMKQILANGPLAVALCIEAVDRGLEMSLDEGLILEANHFGLLAATDDMREGMRAFLDKRTAACKGG